MPKRNIRSGLFVAVALLGGLVAACAAPPAAPIEVTLPATEAPPSAAEETAYAIAQTAAPPGGVGTPPGFPTEVIEQVVSDPRVMALLAGLEQRGLTPELRDASRSELLHDAPGQGYRLGQGWLHVHVYPDAPAAQVAAAAVQAAMPHPIMDWIAPPHFFQCDRLIVLYLGADPSALTALSELCAPPFYTPEPPAAGLAEPPPGFALRFEYGPCFTDVLDTFEQTYTQARVSEPSLTVPVSLPAAQLYKIYLKVVEIEFFNYPEQFVVPLRGAALYHYALTVREGERTHTVTWHDASLTPTTGQAEHLRQLFQLITEITKELPEVQQLPPRPVACV